MKYRGIVHEGKKHGRALGYPTANITLSDETISGVYAGNVSLANHEYHAAIFADQKRQVLEAHILDFSDEVYGTEIQIELCKKLRERIQFENEDELKAQIRKDIEHVVEYFQSL